MLFISIGWLSDGFGSTSRVIDCHQLEGSLVYLANSEWRCWVSTVLLSNSPWELAHAYEGSFQLRTVNTPLRNGKRAVVLVDTSFPRVPNRMTARKYSQSTHTNSSHHMCHNTHRKLMYVHHTPPKCNDLTHRLYTQSGWVNPSLKPRRVSVWCLLDGTILLMMHAPAPIYERCVQFIKQKQLTK